MSHSNSRISYSVIAGSLKGRKIEVPDLGVTRPPLARVRKSIFDFLFPYLQDAKYLDLFSGSGSYLFEATSRGAESVIGVEKEPVLCEAINRRAIDLGVGKSMVCVPDDVFEIIPALFADRKKFDIIMMAPPQYKGIINKTITLLAKNPILSSDGLLLCQHDSSETKTLTFSEFTIDQVRRYGNTSFTVLTNC